MKHLICIVYVITCVSAIFASCKGLRVQFGNSLRYAHKVPLTISAAVKEGWTLTKRQTGQIMPSLKMYCTSNLILCSLYDDTDGIAGLQMAIPQADVTNDEFNWNVQGYTSWETTNSSGRATKFWIRSIYFIPDEALDTPAADRLTAYDNRKILQYGAVWVPGSNGELFAIPDTTTTVAADNLAEPASLSLRTSSLPFTSGRQYYYNMTEETVCVTDAIFPYSVLRQNGSLFGVENIAMGLLPSGSQDYFERLPADDVRTIVPNGPVCFYGLADTYGTLSTQVYFDRNRIFD